MLFKPLPSVKERARYTLKSGAKKEVTRKEDMETWMMEDKERSRRHIYICKEAL